MTKIKIYLAGPYTHRDPAVLQWRNDRLTELAALLLSRGIKPFYSPVTHSHPISLCPTAAQYATDHNVWMGFDLPFLACSEAMWILMLPGWDRSRGVTAEIKFAVKRAIPIHMVSPVYDEMYRLINFHVAPEVSREAALRFCEEATYVEELDAVHP